jgi:hypothetical protein
MTCAGPLITGMPVDSGSTRNRGAMVRVEGHWGVRL